MPPPKRPDGWPFKSFPATQWSLVDRARRPGEEGELALEKLCQGYWLPVYAFLRGRGCSLEDAEDMTQSFFVLILNQGLFRSADAERGRLRSLLLTALKRFHINQVRSEKALKRGGGHAIVPFDPDRAEQRCAAALVTSNDPEKIYFATWARSLFDQAQDKLREIYLRAPHPEVATALASHLHPEDGRVPYRDFAEEFNMKESLLRLHVFRLRRKFQELLREEVLQTVETPEELEDELHWMLGVLDASNVEN